MARYKVQISFEVRAREMSEDKLRVEFIDQLDSVLEDMQGCHDIDVAVDRKIKINKIKKAPSGCKGVA